MNDNGTETFLHEAALHSEIAELRKEVEGLKEQIASLRDPLGLDLPWPRHIAYGFVDGSLHELTDEEASRLSREYEASPQGQRIKADLEASLFSEVSTTSPDPALSAMNKKWSNAALLDTDASPKA